MQTRTWKKGRFRVGMHGFSWFALPVLHVMRLPRATRQPRASLLVGWLCFSATVELGKQGG